LVNQFLKFVRPASKQVEPTVASIACVGKSLTIDLIVDHNISILLKSGEYGGKDSTLAPAEAMLHPQRSANGSSMPSIL